MGVSAVIISAAAAVKSAVDAGEAASTQKKAARNAQREREKAAQKTERLDTIQANRDKLQAIRESRVKRAQLIAQGETLGVSGSSGVSGGVSSLGAQLGGNFAYSDTTAAFGKAIGQDMLHASRIETAGAMKSADLQASSAMYGAISSVAGSYGSFQSLGSSSSVSSGSGVIQNPAYKGQGTLSVGTMRNGAWYPE